MVVLSASIYSLSFPKFDLWFLSFVFLVPVLQLVDSEKQLSPFLILFSFSFFTHLIILYWIPDVMVYYGGMSGILGVFGLIFLSAYISLFYGISGIIIKRVLNSSLTAILLIPAVWISKDLILEKLFGGFPWQFAGYSQYKNIYLIQISEIGGIHLVSFVIIFLNILLFLFFKSREKKYITGFVLTLVFFYTTGYFLSRNDISKEKNISSNVVGIIQPNTGQNFSGNKTWRNVTLEELFKKSKRLKEDGAEFVVWPEYTIGLAPLQNKYIFDRINSFVSDNIPVFAGFTDYKNSEEMYNSIMLFKKDGFDKYDKVRLVPFGEYIPLKKVFFFIDKITDEISDFTSGKKFRNLEIFGRKVSTPICYEIIYPEIVRSFISHGGEAIILVSNDSWYGTTSAPYQLLSMSVFRSVESRRYILRSTSNGISAIIDPRGKISTKIPLNKEKTFTSEFKFRNNFTIYTRVGFLFPYISMLIIILYLLIPLIKGKIIKYRRR